MTTRRGPVSTRRYVPAVSVVVVSFGAPAWTERALRALSDHTPEPHELIVVDNGSGPGTLARLRAAAAEARLVSNPANVGFGPACNQGAEHARGRHLVFLNSDALVRPGWLAPLVCRAERPGVAAVGPMLLNLDGSLQEAGAVVWRDGVTTPLGAGDDPARPEYGFRRTVDYASAACLLVRRDAFLAVGGFDPVYAPGYYEDVDLCLALANRGLRTEYEPAARVVHARGASGASTDALALVARNRPVFRRRFAARLADRSLVPAPDDRRALLAGRDAVASDRILLLADAVPAERSATGRLVAALQAGWPRARLTLLSADAQADAGTEAQALRARGVEVVAPGDGPAWLAERRDHYEVAIVAGRADTTRALEAALPGTQRRAYRLAGPGATGLAALTPGRGPAARAAELAHLASFDGVLAGTDREGALARAFAADRPVAPSGDDEPPPPHGLVVALAGAGVAPPSP